MDKAELLAQLHHEYNRLEAALTPLTGAQLAAPGVWETWSVNDILAHLTVWDARGTGWIQTAAAGTFPAIPLPGVTWAEVDRLNEETYQANVSLPAAEIWAAYRRTFAALIAQLEVLTAEDWARPYRPDDGRGPAMVEVLAGWRLGHLRGHGQPIYEWLARLQEAGTHDH